jgi:hypothetical protein
LLSLSIHLKALTHFVWFSFQHQVYIYNFQDIKVRQGKL